MNINIHDFFKKSLTIDDDVEFQKLYLLYMDAMKHAPPYHEEMPSLMNHILDEGAYKCYKQIIDFMKSDDDLSLHLDMLKNINHRYIYFHDKKFRRKYLDSIEFIFNRYIKKPELFDYFNASIGQSYIVSILGSPDLLALYLKLGLENDKEFKFIDKHKNSTIMDMEQCLQVLIEQSDSAESLATISQSMIVLKSFKEKKALNHSMPTLNEDCIAKGNLKI